MLSPISEATRSGMCEKETKPSRAKSISRLQVYFGRPAWRAWRLYAKPVWHRPTQLRKPRTKRFRSGMERNRRTTLRSMMQKSPASNGMSTLATLRSIR